MPVAPVRERVSSVAVLHDLLQHASEPAIAAGLHVSVRTLRRYAAGEMKMTWVTRTRLEVMIADIAARRAAEQEAAPRTRPSRKREFASGAYATAVA
jgi:hypothetical protein